MFSSERIDDHYTNSKHVSKCLWSNGALKVYIHINTVKLPEHMVCMVCHPHTLLAWHIFSESQLSQTVFRYGLGVSTACGPMQQKVWVLIF